MQEFVKGEAKRVIRMGKHLAALQKIQKKEQEEAKRNGEEPQTWKAWCEEQKMARPSFPNERDCGKYQLIARHPKAYRSGMSIKEARGNKKRAASVQPQDRSRLV